MICLRVCGGAGLAPAAGLIRSLSALPGVTHYRPAAAVSRTQTGTTGPCDALMDALAADNYDQRETALVEATTTLAKRHNMLGLTPRSTQPHVASGRSL